MRKIQIAGAITGALLTLAIQFVAGLPAGGGEMSGLSRYLCWGVIQLPVLLIYQLMGMRWHIDGVLETSLTQLLLMVLVNSILFALIGTIVG